MRPDKLADGKVGGVCREEAEHVNPLLDELVLLYADKTFGGHFKEQLEKIYDMRVLISKEPIGQQVGDNKLVIHKWRWIVERTIS